MSDQDRSEHQDGAQLSGWAKPHTSHQFHFFREHHRPETKLLLSVCAEYLADGGHTYDRDLPLDRSRGDHVPGNCIGCRAWLSMPVNRSKLVQEGVR